MTEHIALVDTAIYPLDLISAAAYSMREDAVAILKETGFEDKDFAELQRSLNELELEGLDDPLGISRPWGETGRKAQDRAHPHDE